MKFLVLIFFILILAFGIVFAWRKLNNPIDQSYLNKTATTLEQILDEKNGITVKVTPDTVTPDTNEWTFNLVLDTHSEELNQDLVKISRIESDDNRIEKTKSWQGDPIGGYHRAGTLTFPALKPWPKTLNLILKINPDDTRRFSWKLE